MVDRQSKEFYQQQLAQAQAAWAGFSRGAAGGYPGGSSGHPGFAGAHMAAATNPYENYMQQLQQFAGLSSQSNAAASMFGGAAANFLGNGAKDMAAGFSSTPFSFNPSHHHSMAAFSNIANYHRPLPAHSPLPAPMKNSSGGGGGGSSGPLPAHMRSMAPTRTLDACELMTAYAYAA